MFLKKTIQENQAIIEAVTYQGTTKVKIKGGKKGLG